MKTSFDNRQEVYSQNTAAKFPLTNLSASGAAFRPLVSAVQAAVTNGGGSGLYYVNTMGKHMHQFKGSNNFLSALKASDGGIGGGQARLAQLPCNPTMLFMAAALIKA